ncbi:hypothetical protein DJ90_6027 [Paenibacillus macerans]|uniref:Uncharacterized protein n=1 Tax=Paenibacillus macerans TaxID=44252 RepID=A0A090ZG83_PAEMA|nr:hypothetical protein DJ90_6027 [Paenibacillus macerans]
MDFNILSLLVPLDLKFKIFSNNSYGNQHIIIYIGNFDILRKSDFLTIQHNLGLRGFRIDFMRR